MNKVIDDNIDEELYKSWEGRTIAPEGMVVYEDWALDVTFTDGTKFHLWVAQDSLHVEEEQERERNDT